MTPFSVKALISYIKGQNDLHKRDIQIYKDTCICFIYLHEYIYFFCLLGL